MKTGRNFKACGVFSYNIKRYHIQRVQGKKGGDGKSSLSVRNAEVKMRLGNTGEA